jgi:hypothetical protein
MSGEEVELRNILDQLLGNDLSKAARNVKYHFDVNINYLRPLIGICFIRRIRCKS